MAAFPSISGLAQPGSQPPEEDGATLEYMQMPDDMRVFAAPELPEPEDTAGLAAAKAVMARMCELLDGYRRDGEHNILDLAGLDAANLDFINQLLGEGEVSVVAGENIQAQEAVLAGVWRVRQTAPDGRLVSDTVEVASFPTRILALVFANAQPRIAAPESFDDNVFNAPALIAEINAHIPASARVRGPHVINLSLLPHTQQDLELLDKVLGRGDITILSRGYGNCRIASTGTQSCWWVQYYNSQDTLILNSIEMTALPDVACASPEDIADSAERLREIREVYR